MLFDYGVVLSGPPQPAAWAQMKQITGLEEAAFERAYWGPRHDYDRGSLTGHAYWQTAGRSAGLELDPDAIASLIEADTALWTGLNQPMVEWAKRLQKAGTRTGILSNLGDAMEAGVLARHGWLTGFDYTLWSHRVRLCKPDPAIYQIAADGLECAPHNVLFIDDREENIAGAIRAGMQAILYADQERFERDLEQRGFRALWLAGTEP